MIADVDYRAAAVYLASTCSEAELSKEGMLHLVPRRKHKQGSRPSIRTKELAGGLSRSKERIAALIKKAQLAKEEGSGSDDKVKVDPESKWTMVTREYTDLDKRQIVGKVLEVGVRIILSNHVYKQFLQTEGGRTHGSETDRRSGWTSYGQMGPGLQTYP